MDNCPHSLRRRRIPCQGRPNCPRPLPKKNSSPYIAPCHTDKGLFIIPPPYPRRRGVERKKKKGLPLRKGRNLNNNMIVLRHAPTLFHGIIGHAGILRFLERSASNPTNAYLFTDRRSPRKAPNRGYVRSRVAGSAGGFGSSASSGRCVLEPVEGKATVAIEANVRDARTRMSSRPSVGRRMVMYARQADRLREDGMNVRFESFGRSAGL